ncbi:MAG: hypothetical protein K1000chlam4_00191 [Chlamydiae bacterium]|nr:hypothetical protein [Chlamydiota bacterium]
MSPIKLLVKPYPLVCLRRACVRPEILSSAWGARKIPHQPLPPKNNIRSPQKTPHQPPPRNSIHLDEPKTTEVTILTYEEGLQNWRKGVEEAIKNSAESK